MGAASVKTVGRDATQQQQAALLVLVTSFMRASRRCEYHSRRRYCILIDRGRAILSRSDLCCIQWMPSKAAN